jgi:hypothetical protein
VSEARAGLENDNADADPPAIWGRPRERGSNRHAHPLDPPGNAATAAIRQRAEIERFTATEALAIFG